MSRARLMRLLGAKQKVARSSSTRRRDRPGFTREDAIEEANEGWKKYRTLKAMLELAEVKENIHKTVVLLWVIFYAFLTHLTDLQGVAGFLHEETVAAGGATFITWLAFQVYRAGPLWFGLFTLVGISCAVLIAIGVM